MPSPIPSTLPVQWGYPISSVIYWWGFPISNLIFDEWGIPMVEWGIPRREAHPPSILGMGIRPAYGSTFQHMAHTGQ